MNPPNAPVSDSLGLEDSCLFWAIEVPSKRAEMHS